MGSVPVCETKIEYRTVRGKGAEDKLVNHWLLASDFSRDDPFYTTLIYTEPSTPSI